MRLDVALDPMPTPPALAPTLERAKACGAAPVFLFFKRGEHVGDTLHRRALAATLQELEGGTWTWSRLLGEAPGEAHIRSWDTAGVGWFYAGQGWWGSSLWTVDVPGQDWIVSISASATD